MRTKKPRGRGSREDEEAASERPQRLLRMENHVAESFYPSREVTERS
jgi:hypothetical protein